MLDALSSVGRIQLKGNLIEAEELSAKPKEIFGFLLVMWKQGLANGSKRIPACPDYVPTASIGSIASWS